MVGQIDREVLCPAFVLSGFGGREERGRSPETRGSQSTSAVMDDLPDFATEKTSTSAAVISRRMASGNGTQGFQTIMMARTTGK
jgi:hypothetical protein